MTTMTTTPPAGADPAQAELLDVRAVASMLDVSTRSVHRLAASGRMPQPVRLGTSVRWRADELRQWIGEGCPSTRRDNGGDEH